MLRIFYVSLIRLAKTFSKGNKIFYIFGAVRSELARNPYPERFLAS